MKYKKGTFIVIPNTEYFKGKPSLLLSVFFWLCYHADEEGICFPTRKKIGGYVGVNVRTIDKYIKILEEDGLLKKTERKKANSKENTSNLYQLMQVEIPPSERGIATGVLSNDTETIPIINYTHLTSISGVETPDKKTKKKSKKQIRLESPFSFEEELKLLRDSMWKPNQIMHNYFIVKKYRFTNFGQFDTEVEQCKIHAIKLQGYSSKQINEAMNYCIDNMKDIPWNLSTVVKIIANVVNTNG